jgi:hypothetical protein
MNDTVNDNDNGVMMPSPDAKNAIGVHGVIQRFFLLNEMIFLFTNYSVS